MKLEKNIISSFQLTFLVITFMTGGSTAILTILNISKHHTWLAGIIASVISSFFVWGYIRLALNFPGKTLIEINELIFGPYLGKLISVLYLAYFSLMLLMELHWSADYLNTYVLPKTPIFVILFFLLLISAQAVSKGIAVIGRLSFIFFLVPVAIYYIPSALIIPEFNLSNLLPVFDGTLNDLVQCTHIFSSLVLCDLVVFLMIFPFHNNPGKTTRAVFIGYIYLCLASISSIIMVFAVLGNLTLILYSPYLEVVRLINVAKILTRLEITVTIVVIGILFFKVTLLYYCTALGIAQLFKLNSYLPVILPLGIIFLSFTLNLNDFIPGTSYIYSYIWPVATIPVQIIIPVASLLLTKIRKLGIQQSGK